jgi:hypothetical protein
MSRPLLAWVGFGVLLAVALVSAGWGGATPPSDPHARRPVTQDPAAYVVAAHVVQQAALRRRDLPAGFAQVAPRNRGERDALDYLDLCGAPAPGAEHRLATDGRIYAGAGRSVRTTVVAYRPGFAEQALARLRDAPQSCARPVPPRPVQQPGTLALRVRLGFPVQRAGPRGRHELVVLRSGDVLSLVELDGTAEGLTLRLARLLGARLQASTGGLDRWVRRTASGRVSRAQRRARHPPPDSWGGVEAGHGPVAMSTDEST